MGTRLTRKRRVHAEVIVVRGRRASCWGDHRLRRTGRRGGLFLFRGLLLLLRHARGEHALVPNLVKTVLDGIPQSGLDGVHRGDVHNIGHEVRAVVVGLVAELLWHDEGTHFPDAGPLEGKVPPRHHLLGSDRAPPQRGLVALRAALEHVADSVRWCAVFRRRARDQRAAELANNLVPFARRLQRVICPGEERDGRHVVRGCTPREVDAQRNCDDHVEGVVPDSARNHTVVAVVVGEVERLAVQRRHSAELNAVVGIDCCDGEDVAAAVGCEAEAEHGGGCGGVFGRWGERILDDEGAVSHLRGLPGLSRRHTRHIVQTCIYSEQCCCCCHLQADFFY
eukprot:PhM_4_TR2439/c0_g1_i2/m.78748